MQALIVDNSRASLLYTTHLLSEHGDLAVVACDDPVVALGLAAEQSFDIVIVAYVLAGLHGIDVIRQMRGMPEYIQVPIIMLTATNDPDVRLAALEAGATDFIPKSSNKTELGIRIRNTLLLARALRQRIDNANTLMANLHQATEALKSSQEDVVFRLSLAVEYRDNTTGCHILRVADYSRMIAREMGLDEGLCHQVSLASLLHDVGKVAIPDRILLKSGKLTLEEIDIIRTHAAIGAKILGDSSSALMNLAAEIAGHHHERWDGRGYPHGLSGADIPLSARIVAVADVFDALTTERPYKEALSFADAFAHLAAERGAHFDPACVDAFLRAQTSRAEARSTALDDSAGTSVATVSRPPDRPAPIERLQPCSEGIGLRSRLAPHRPRFSP